MKDIFPPSEALLAAQALWEKISASHVFLFPLTSVEPLQICADTSCEGTRLMASGSAWGDEQRSPGNAKHFG